MAELTALGKTMIEFNGTKGYAEDIRPGSRDELLLQNYRKAQEKIRLGNLIKVEDIFLRAGCTGPEYLPAFKSLLRNCVYPPICLPLSTEYRLMAPVISVDEVYYASPQHGELIVAAVAFFGVIGPAVSGYYKSGRTIRQNPLGINQKKFIDSQFIGMVV